MIADRSLCPENVIHSLALYQMHKYRTGGFLHAVLCNNLVEAVKCADSDSLAALPHIVAYIYWELPSNIWGSPAAVDAHLYGKSEEETDYA